MAITYAVSGDKTRVTVTTETEEELVITNVVVVLANQEAEIADKILETQEKIDRLAGKENAAPAEILEPLQENLDALNAIKQACIAKNAWPE